MAAVSVIVAGCGGGSSSSSAADQTYVVEADTTMTTADISKAQFVAHVDNICRHVWPVIENNFTKYSETQDPKLRGKARFADAVQLSLLAGIDFHIFDNIYDSQAPSGDGPEVEAMIGSMQSAVERGQKRLVPISSIAQVVHLFGEYNQRARRYGITRCFVNAARLHNLKLGKL